MSTQSLIVVNLANVTQPNDSVPMAAFFNYYDGYPSYMLPKLKEAEKLYRLAVTPANVGMSAGCASRHTCQTTRNVTAAMGALLDVFDDLQLIAYNVPLPKHARDATIGIDGLDIAHTIETTYWAEYVYDILVYCDTQGIVYGWEIVQGDEHQNGVFSDETPTKVYIPEKLRLPEQFKKRVRI